MCISLHKEVKLMPTNLSIDTQLLNDALQIGGLRTKKDTVNLALQEFIKKREATEIIALFGEIKYDEDYNYKKMRQRSL